MIFVRDLDGETLTVSVTSFEDVQQTLRINRPFHDLKTVEPYFSYVWNGVKDFELRLNDRQFEAGHYLHLRRWRQDIETYTNHSILAKVKYCFRASDMGLDPEYVILGLSPDRVKIIWGEP